jgi:hypothetical protein
VTGTENGKRRQVTTREAVIAQLVNKSAAAELRATKMLIDMLRDIEKRAEPAIAELKRAVREQCQAFGASVVPRAAGRDVAIV